MPEELVTRLYERLVHELRERGHPPDEPVKVAQLYEELVPYRRVRSDLGLELNADYEHALLRLLAGERDLLRVEPAEAREELRCEAETAYPAVGLFRKFPDSDVWITMPPVPASPAPAAPAAASARTGAPSDAPQEPAAWPEPESAGTGSADGTAAACAFCGGVLPTGPRVRFCPYCGGDQRLRPCTRCDAVLEREWRYCITCGQEAGGP